MVLVADLETAGRPVDRPLVSVQKMCEREQDEVSSVGGVARLLVRRKRDIEFNLVVGHAFELMETMVQLEYHRREIQIGYVVGSCSHGRFQTAVASTMDVIGRSSCQVSD